MAVAPLAALLLAGGARAVHNEPCTPTSADPHTVTVLDTPDGRTWYLEERGVPPPANAAPMPGSGLVLGDGTWLYEEANRIAGLQRGSMCGFAACPCNEYDSLCLFGEDPVRDEYCAHGPDMHYWLQEQGWPLP